MKLRKFVVSLSLAAMILSGCSSDTDDSLESLTKVSKNLIEIRYSAKNKEQLQAGFEQYRKFMSDTVWEQEFDLKSPFALPKNAIPPATKRDYKFFDVLTKQEGDTTYIFVLGIVTESNIQDGEESVWNDKIIARFAVQDDIIVGFEQL